jgi:uncharacterized cupredoxin-like copper-binding protein
MNRIAKLSGAAMAVILLGTACSSSKSAAQNSGSTQPSTTPGRVAVTLSEFAVSPNIRAVPAGSVTFSVTNSGKVEHEFVVLRTSDAPGALPVKGGEASEDGIVDEIQSVQPGAAGSLTVDLTSGHYVLICNLPDHYAAGMYAGLTVA